MNYWPVLLATFLTRLGAIGRWNRYWWEFLSFRSLLRPWLFLLFRMDHSHIVAAVIFRFAQQCHFYVWRDCVLDIHRICLAFCRGYGEDVIRAICTWRCDLRYHVTPWLRLLRRLCSLCLPIHFQQNLILFVHYIVLLLCVYPLKQGSILQLLFVNYWKIKNEIIKFEKKNCLTTMIIKTKKFDENKIIVYFFLI